MTPCSARPSSTSAIRCCKTSLKHTQQILSYVGEGKKQKHITHSHIYIYKYSFRVRFRCSLRFFLAICVEKHHDRPQESMLSPTIERNLRVRAPRTTSSASGSEPVRVARGAWLRTLKRRPRSFWSWPNGWRGGTWDRWRTADGL